RMSKAQGNAFFVDATVFPQTRAVLETRAAGFGFELIFGEPEEAARHDVFGALLQYPAAHGGLCDLSAPIAALHARGAVVAVACDLLALTLLKPPGEMGADIALGSAQRFGVPMGYGGPHAAFFATREAFVRAMPGRIIGVSKDARGKTAYRMTLQTREQHIRREKANSNICTSQVLLANMAGMYAVWHGPQGLATIAARVHRLTALLARALGAEGSFFDTFEVKVGAGGTASLLAAAAAAGYNLRRVGDQTIGVSCDETTTREDIAAVARLFGKQLPSEDGLCAIPPGLQRQSPFLTHPVFNSHHSEHALLRYLKRLQNRDLALDQAMIPLGSCTMKLNPAAAMLPVSWPEFAEMHPFAPREQAAGYRALFDELENQLKAITGFDAVSLQPNAGSQGEYAGLMAIRRYHESRGEGARLIEDTRNRPGELGAARVGHDAEGAELVASFLNGEKSRRAACQRLAPFGRRQARELVIGGEFRLDDAGSAVREARDIFGQAVIGLGAEHKIDRWCAAAYFLPLGLCDAACDADGEALAAPVLLGLQIAQPAKLGIDLLGRFLADMAGVQDDDIGIFRRVDFAIASGRHDIDHAGRIIDVHLAAIRLHEDFLARPDRLGGLALVRRGATGWRVVIVHCVRSSPQGTQVNP
ncbi:MAG: hypothetical protein CVT73_16620, partial [Alphaproteobacteria bacterium HGW-Alphaproteobacteria-12]